tara:strand:+ start:260 stop:526 length:267 start_codon:yes stop_codon:yes gene_type:complete
MSKQLDNLIEKDSRNTSLWETLTGEMESDDDSSKELNKLYNRYRRFKSTKTKEEWEVIDSVFITICGWSFATLINKTNERIEGETNEH